MSYATDSLLARLRAGGTVTPADTVATIMSAEELKAYGDGLKARGAYTADAVQAVLDRARQMGWTV